MRCLFAVWFTGLLAVGTLVPASAGRPPQALLDQSCTQNLATTAPHAHPRHAAVAIVLRVDHTSGLLDVATDSGHIVTFVAPATIQELQEGDQILVCLAEESSAEGLHEETAPY